MSQLHLLHARAGHPSVREIGKAVHVSHHSVHQLFASSELPKLPLLMRVTEYLATESAPRVQGREEVVNEWCDTIDGLWTQAHRDQVFDITAEPETSAVMPPSDVNAASVSSPLIVTGSRNGLPVLGESKALIVGCADYEDVEYLRATPGVELQVQQLHTLLTGGEEPPFSDESVALLLSPSRMDVLLALEEAAMTATDTLLLHFTGHGAMSDRGEPLLISRDTLWDHLSYTAIESRTIRDLVVRSPARRVLMIIDANMAGRWHVGSDGAGAESTSLVLSSTNRIATADEGGAYFTGGLIDLLANGIVGGPEYLDIFTIYQELNAKAQKDGMPQPKLSGALGQHPLTLVKNSAFRWSSPLSSDIETASIPPSAHEQSATQYFAFERSIGAALIRIGATPERPQRSDSGVDFFIGDTENRTAVVVKLNMRAASDMKRALAGIADEHPNVKSVLLALGTTKASQPTALKRRLEIEQRIGQIDLPTEVVFCGDPLDDRPLRDALKQLGHHFERTSGTELKS